MDVQPSSDRIAMVFHDYGLRRLTGETGPIAQRPASELRLTRLIGASEGVPTLRQVLDEVDGKVPLLIEIKDQDGSMGLHVGALERAVAEDIDGYSGDLALMSFNPNSIKCLQTMNTDRALGLVTSDFNAKDWPLLHVQTRDRLREIPDFSDVGASFISHKANDLSRARVAELKSKGAKVLCWTVKSEAQERVARKIADNITFEGYAASLVMA